MRPMPLAPSYCFQLSLRPWGGIDINLNRIADGATKRFFVACARSEEPYINHMESLTESQCEQFLAEKTPKKKEKKNAEQLQTDGLPKG